MLALSSAHLACALSALVRAAPVAPPPAPPPAGPAPVAAVAVAPAAVAPAAVASPLARWDSLWTRRDDPVAAAELKGLAEGFLGGHSYGELWRTARWYFWLANGTRNDDDLKKSLAKTGWDAGERAKALNPAGLAAMYWTSVDIGMYSQAVGIFKALTGGLESKFRDPILAVKAADPNHRNAEVNYVGPEISLGRYWYTLPWPKRSLTKSKAELTEAVAARPMDLRARYYFAQTLADDGDYVAAKVQLDAIRAGSIDYDPPEARRIKKLGAAFAKKIADKLH